MNKSIVYFACLCILFFSCITRAKAQVSDSTRGRQLLDVMEGWLKNMQ